MLGCAKNLGIRTVRPCKGNRRGQKTRDKKEDSGPMTLGDISGLLSGMGTESSSRELERLVRRKLECAKWATLSAHRGTRSQFKRRNDLHDLEIE